MRVCSHFKLLKDDPRIVGMDSETMALHAAQIEREEREIDRRWDLLIRTVAQAGNLEFTGPLFKSLAGERSARLDDGGPLR